MLYISPPVSPHVRGRQNFLHAAKLHLLKYKLQKGLTLWIVMIRSNPLIAVGLFLVTLSLFFISLFLFGTSFSTNHSNFAFSGCNVDMYSDLFFDDEDVTIEIGASQSEIDRMPPSIVHFIWPEENEFSFKHFLSLKSIVRYLQPQKIIFHFGTCGFFAGQSSPGPRMDLNSYNHYWEEAILRIPNLVLKQDIGCYRNASTKDRKKRVIEQVIRKNGGYFVSEDVIFKERFTLGKVRVDPTQKVIFSKTTKLEEIALAYGHSHHTRYTWTIQGHCNECILVEGVIFPHQIWSGDGVLEKTARELFYHNSAVVKLDETTGKIPLLCHYVVIGQSDIKFTMFVSVLSCIFILRADVFVHGNSKPSGPNWARLQHVAGNRVRFIDRPLPETVFGNSVNHPSHISDVWRIEILLKHGGIYCDWDLIWLKPVDTLLNFDAVASFDVMDWSPYPDVLNLGAFLAKPGAQYLQYLRKALIFYKEKGDWPLSYFYNACLIPYKVYECHPNTLKIEKSLQVICNRGRCHPTWLNDYKDEMAKSGFENANLLFDHAYSVHYTYPDLKELDSMESLIQNQHSSFMSEIATQILKVSKIL